MELVGLAGLGREAGGKHLIARHLLSLIKRGQTATANNTTVAIVNVGRIDDTHIHLACSHWAEFDLPTLTITQERPTGGVGPKGATGGGVVDVSGDDVDVPSESDKGKLFLDAFKHDAAFAVRTVPGHY